MTRLEAIPTPTEWRNLRNAAGGKSNLVGSVNVAKLLAAYGEAANGQHGQMDILAAQVRPLLALNKGLTEYQAKMPKGNAQLVALITEMRRVTQVEIKRGEAVMKPITSVAENLREVLTRSAALSKRGDGKSYATMWSEYVRGLRIALRSLAKVERVAIPLAKRWEPYVDDAWDLSGEHVTKGLTDAAQIKGSIEYAAREIQRIAVGTRDDLRKANLIH